MTQEEIDQLWQALAFERIAHLAYTLRAFCSDDLWQLLDKLPRPDNARTLLSTAMRQAAAQGLITKSDLSVVSRRGISGGRPLNVWMSVPLGATLQDAIAYVVRQKQTIKMPPPSPPTLFQNAEVVADAK